MTPYYVGMVVGTINTLLTVYVIIPSIIIIRNRRKEIDAR